MADVFAGRRLVVTGASSGIGRALTCQLAARGARVVAVARSTDKLQTLMRDAGKTVLAIPTNVADQAAVDRLAALAYETCGQIDIVVNNAGIGYLEPFLASERERWQETIEVNLIGALLVTRAFLPAMLKAGEGMIVNVGSSGASGWPYMTLYAASKAALQAASVSLDREYVGRGIRVLSVEIGSTVGTDFGSRFNPAQIASATSAWNALGIDWNTAMATPDESANKIIQAIESALETATIRKDTARADAGSPRQKAKGEK